MDEKIAGTTRSCQKNSQLAQPRLQSRMKRNVHLPAHLHAVEIPARNRASAPFEHLTHSTEKTSLRGRYFCADPKLAEENNSM
jgi:hypothetical protein